MGLTKEKIRKIIEILYIIQKSDYELDNSFWRKAFRYVNSDELWKDQD